MTLTAATFAQATKHGDTEIMNIIGQMKPDQEYHQYQPYKFHHQNLR